MEKAKKRMRTREEVVGKTLDALRENYPDDVSIIVSGETTKSAKARARKRIAKGNDEIIQDMLIVDDQYRDRFRGPIRITVSLAFSSFVAMLVLAAIATFFVHPAAGEINWIALAAAVELVAGVVLVLSYRSMLARYLELRIRETFAAA